MEPTDEELEQQHCLPPRALRTATRALQRWVLSNTLSGAGGGVSIPHVGRLIYAAGAKGDGDVHLVFELSDGLTRGQALQLGRGVSRGVGGAAARGVVEEANYTQLAMNYTSGSLSKADVAAALKLVAQRLADGVKARRPVSLDLGAGTLSIRNGLAEFRFAPGGGAAAAGSSVCSSAAAPAAGAAGGSRVSGASQRRAVAAAAVAPGSQVSGQGSLHLPAGASCCGGGSRLTADVLLRHQQLQQGSRAASVLAGSALGKSRVSGAAAPRRPSAVPSAAAPAPASGPPQGAGGAGTLPAAVGGAGGQPASAGAKAKKPASVVQPPGAAAPASAAAMVQSVRAAREAAKANARTRVATFVLPCGGPGDEAAPAPQPQGRSKPAAARPVELPGTGDAGLPPAKAAAMRLAEERAAKERAARAQQEAEAVAGMAARKAALDAEAEAIKAELRKRKELLATTLQSQVLERKIATLEGKGKV